VSGVVAAIRAAQGRDDEAEELYRKALEVTKDGIPALELEVLERMVVFYRDRGRDADAAACQARIVELVPSESVSTERIA
jgi:hypothetical protein